MENDRSVAAMNDEEVLAAFGTAEDPARRGFDEETQLRVLAHELVKARGRLSYYRTLYSSFVPEGKRFMIENLADGDDVQGLPVKLAFTDDGAEARRLEESPGVTIWTEPELLDALTQERAILDFFTTMLGEFVPALQVG